jgi:hypothetical protein
MATTSIYVAQNQSGRIASDYPDVQDNLVRASRYLILNVLVTGISFNFNFKCKKLNRYIWINQWTEETGFISKSHTRRRMMQRHLELNGIM